MNALQILLLKNTLPVAEPGRVDDPDLFEVDVPFFVQSVFTARLDVDHKRPVLVVRQQRGDDDRPGLQVHEIRLNDYARPLLLRLGTSDGLKIHPPNFELTVGRGWDCHWSRPSISVESHAASSS